MQKKLVKLCVCAVMSALYVGLDVIAVTLSAPFGGTLKISISALPVIICAVLFGPVWGGAVGFVGAFLGQLISPYGITATTILWATPAMIRGIAMGLLFILFKKSLKPYIIVVQTIITSLLVTAINTLVMYVDAKIYNYPVALFGIALINRIVVGIITAIVLALIVPYIIKLMEKIIR